MVRSPIRIFVVLLALVAPPFPGFGEARAETWRAAGYYSVTTEGWTRRSATANDAIFDCLRCGGRASIAIGIREPNKPETGWTTNAGFISSLNTDQRRREFARIYMENWAQGGARYEIQQVGFGQVDRLQARQFAGTVTMAGSLNYMTHMQVVHKGRFMTFNVFSDKPATAASRAALDSFFDGFKLEK